MKIFNFIKKYQLILFLSFLVIILFFLKIFYKESEENKNNIIPTPIVLTPTKEVTKEKTNDFDYEVLNDGNPEYPLVRLLPYSTDFFKIIGYDDPYTLVVRVKNKNKLEVEEEIKEWIEKNIPGDNEHKIIFTE